MFKIGDKVKIKSNGRTGVISCITRDIAMIIANDIISFATAAYLADLEPIKEGEGK